MKTDGESQPIAGVLATAALKRPVATTMVFLALAVLGLLSARTLPIQLLPGYAAPEAYVNVYLPGADADEIERTVLRRLEGEIATAGGIETMTSVARTGSGTIRLEMERGADPQQVTLRVQQRLAAARESLPEQVFLDLSRFDTSTFSNFVMVLSLRGDADVETMRRIAEEIATPLLQSRPGVVSIGVQGGASKQIAVFLDPARARAAGASVLDVRQVLASATRPVQSVGDVTEPSRRMAVVLDGRATKLSDIADAPVKGGVRVSDVARLELALGSSADRYRVNGLTSVGLFAFKDPSANLIATAGGLREAVAEFNEQHAGEGIQLGIDFDASEMIEENVKLLSERALTGGILALLVLLVFLRDLRTVAVVAVAIPAALLISGLLFRMAGLTLNILSLLGLALSIGMLLDNAIVVIESIAARREAGDDGLTAARRGVLLVSRAALAGTAATLVVFVPLFVIEVDETPLFRELALSVALPLMASLFVALTLVPVMASRLLPRRAAKQGVRWPGPFGLPRPSAWRTAYSVVVRAALRHPAATSGGLLGLVLLALVFGLPLVAIFAEPPRPSQERIVVKAELPPGTDAEVSNALSLQIEALASTLPEVHEVQANVREREVEVAIVFKEADKRAGALHVGRVREKLKTQVRELKGKQTRIEVDPPPDADAPQQEGGGDLFGSAGSRETVRVSGPAGPELESLAVRARETLAQVRGIGEGSVRSDAEGRRPTLEIVPSRDRLAELGLTSAEITGTLWATRREGEQLPHPFRLDDEDIDVALYVEGADERTLDDVRRFPVTTSSGARIPLESVASIRTGSEVPEARRFERERTITIGYGFDPWQAKSAEVVRLARLQVDRAMAALPRPPGHAIEVVHADESLGDLRKMLYLGLALVFATLAITFESVTLPLLVMLSVPLAAVGVIASLVLTGTGANAFVMLALVVLLGLVVNQGILLVDRSQALIAAGSRVPAAVLRASQSRLRPILMTTAVTSVGLMPLATSSGGEQEIWPPFARALLGGLISSTLISLVLLPAGSLLFGRLGRLIRELGTPLALVSSVVVAGVLWWAYFVADLVVSEPLRWVLVLPAWLLALIVARVILGVARGEHPPDLVGEGAVEVRVRNARKIYGGRPRPWRELARLERWREIALRHGMPLHAQSAPLARTDLTWQVGALGLLGYMLSLATSTWGQFLLAIPTLVVLGALARTLAVLVRRPGAWPPQGWAARVAPLFIALATWGALWLRRRDGSVTDLITLVLAGIVLGTWSLAHVIWRGGLLGVARRKLAPAPVVALGGVSLAFENGLHGLLGPNGAGKSTLMRLMVNLYEPSRGSVTVNGFEIGSHAASLQPRIGYLPQFFGVPPRMTARQYLHHQALLAGRADRAERGALVSSVLEEVGLGDRGDEAMGGFSGGMRQRVGIARTLLNVPRIVVVDEPTVGLDPRERIRLRGLLQELARTRIVILSTHVIEDIGQACRDVVVLDKGQVLFRGSPEEMVARAAGQSWLFDLPESALGALQATSRITSTTPLDGGRVRVRGVGPRPEGALDVAPSLEDAYLLLLGRTPREAPARVA